MSTNVPHVAVGHFTPGHIPPWDNSGGPPTDVSPAYFFQHGIFLRLFCFRLTAVHTDKLRVGGRDVLCRQMHRALPLLGFSLELEGTTSRQFYASCTGVLSRDVSTSSWHVSFTRFCPARHLRTWHFTPGHIPPQTTAPTDVSPPISAGIGHPLLFQVVGSSH